MPPLPKRTMGTLWWTKRGAYFVVMLRELSSFFIGFYLLMLICLLYKVSEGPEAYDSFVKFLGTPGMIGFHVVALAFALLHTITWFNLTPKAMVVWIGEEKLSPFAIVAPNYLAWVGVTGLILWAVGVITL